KKSTGPPLHPAAGGTAARSMGTPAHRVACSQAVRGLLERPPPAKEGPLAPALKQAAGEHAVVAGLNPAPIIRQFGDNLPPQGEAFRPLLKTQLATLLIDLDGGVRGDLRVDFAGEADARQAKEALQAGLDLARAGLGQAAKEAAGGGAGPAKFADLLKQAETDFKDVAVRQDGAHLEVAAHVKTDLAPAAVAPSQAAR